MQPTIQDMIERIQEVISDKTLKFGCKMKILPPEGFEKYDDVFYSDGRFFAYKELRLIYVDESSRGEPYWYEVAMGIGGYHSYKPFQIKNKIFKDMIKANKIEIIGHPVLIGSVLDWIEKYRQENKNRNYDIDEVIDKRTNKRLPLESQTDEAIAYIYSLLPADE